MEAALMELLPSVVSSHSFVIHVHQGKPDLLRKLEQRLRGYARIPDSDLRVVVIVDRDNDDCRELKHTLTKACERSRCSALCRIAIEELEAWFLGDIEALQTAYPRVSPRLAQRAAFRDPDAIAGGTAEALERELTRAGYFSTGMPKVEVARRVAAHMDPERNRSRSFQVLVEGLRRTVA